MQYNTGFQRKKELGLSDSSLGSLFFSEWPAQGGSEDVEGLCLCSHLHVVNAGVRTQPAF